MQVFRYLQSLDQLRNPVRRDIQGQPWVLWWRDLPDHPDLIRGQFSAPALDTDDADSSDDLLILNVRRPKTSDAPVPPTDLADWLEPGWENVSGSVRVKDSLLVPDQGDLSIIESFDDDPKRPALLAQYRARWAKWSVAERPARDTLRVFERLYDLYTQLQREGENYEVVFGDGLLTWRRDDGAVKHPVLLQRVILEFDPSTPEFTVYEGTQGPELYGSLFRSMRDVNPIGVGQSRSELDGGNIHPLGGEETDEFLRRLVVRLNPRGQFAEAPVPRSNGDTPVITRDSVLFLRRRTLGYSAALEGILEQLPSRADLPPALMRITGSMPESLQNPEGSDVPSWEAVPNGEDEVILLSKPANPEQLDIARRLERFGAVLVQGPPGTGKTHTIGNLIGHLLAQGKSILVTSHTAKALKVVREQVVESLRPLCVSVFNEGSAQLEQAVDAIADRLASLNAAQLEREATHLQKTRLRVLSDLRKTRNALREARAGEYQAVIFAGEEYLPSDAAKWLAQHESDHAWIPAPVTEGVPIPLTNGELIELYATNVLVLRDDEAELARTLPDPAGLLSPTDFARVTEELASLSTDDTLEYRSDLWSGDTSDESGDQLAAIYSDLKKAIQPMAEAERWWLAAAEAGWGGGPRRKAWEDLIVLVQKVNTEAAEAEAKLLEHGPEVPPDCLPGRAVATAESMVRHLKNGGQLNAWTLLTHGDWKVLLNAARVNGQRPSTLEHFEVIHQYLHLATSRSSLVLRWRRQMVPLGAPDETQLGPKPEYTFRQYTTALQAALDWHTQTWKGLQEALEEQGLRWEMFLAETPPNVTEFGEIQRLRDAVTERLGRVISAEILRRRQRWWQSQATILQQRLDLVGKDGAKVVRDLKKAVSGQNADQYAKAFQRLVQLSDSAKALMRRRELLSRLEASAPAWADQIRRRVKAHGGGDLPGDPGQAWKWRQLQDELDRRARISLDELQAKIDKLSNQLREVTADLVERRAWESQLKNTTLEQQQALVGWKQVMTRMGKRTGKRVPRLQAEARRLMKKCQTAVPVWIMPLSRVAETYDPREARFDVVIIDEASQADLMALIALFMAKQVIVVGDHEQVSPLAIGQRTDEVQHLIDEHLNGIPNAVLYDGRFSVYDLAQTAFQPIILKEHFRCVRPIIEFSNHLSYNGNIKPLRDASQVVRRPHTVPYRIRASRFGGGVNEDEALAVASLMVAAAEQPEYKDATFGAISLVGDEQARRIEMLVRERMGFAESERRRVLCGNSAEFQGDERDVVFLSMVDTPAGDGPLSLRSDGPEKMYKKRFNVAASRARDQLWVVYSLNPETDLQAGDIRRRLIDHVKDPDSIAEAINRAEIGTESEFERQVARRLAETGYRVESQRKVGAYRIDLVVSDLGGRQLAVECDGERWHPPEKLAEDMARQAILERLGWRFHRIRGSEYFRNPDQTMGRLFAHLESLGVMPDARGQEAPASEGVDELLERIKRRAADLRREWSGESGLGEDVDANDSAERSKPRDEAQPVFPAGGQQTAETLRGKRLSPGKSRGPEASESKKDKPADPWRGNNGRSANSKVTGRVDRPAKPNQDGPSVRVGSTFIILDRSSGEELTLLLATPSTADIEQGRISLASPLGRAVFGRRSGDTVKVIVQGKVFEYTLLEVSA